MRSLPELIHSSLAGNGGAAMLSAGTLTPSDPKRGLVLPASDSLRPTLMKPVVSAIFLSPLLALALSAGAAAATYTVSRSRGRRCWSGARCARRMTVGICDDSDWV